MALRTAGWRAGDAVVAEAFEHAAGDVGAGRVLHGVVVGEGDVFEERAVARAVEGGPAAVVVLHGQEPVDAALDGGCARRSAGALEGHGDHGGVVDVGVMGVGEFEEPAGGLDVGAVLAPSRRRLRHSLLSSHVAVLAASGSSGPRPASARACSAMPVSQTGEKQG